MVKAKKFVYARRFENAPKVDDFTLEEEELRPLEDGGKKKSDFTMTTP